MQSTYTAYHWIASVLWLVISSQWISIAFAIHSLGGQ